MKYKVTSKHPYLKDIIIEGKEDQYRINYNTDNIEWSREILLDNIDVKSWIDIGWIEEIQEPEFTKNDMIEYAKYCEDNIKRVFKVYQDNSFAVSPHFNKWIKEYKA